MSREHAVVLLGVVVALAPFAGLPLSWLSILLPSSGILVAIIGMSQLARRRRSRIIHEEISTDATS